MTTNLWIVFMMLAFFLGGLLFYQAFSWWDRFCFGRRMKRGVKAEVKAEKILRRYGYKVTAVQQPTTMAMKVDGKTKTYEVCPDAIARRKKRLYLVEVKTGARAVDPLFRETRRQLLEYYHGFPVDGVLLVNADAERVHQIEFSSKAVHRPSFLFRKMVAAFVVGAAFAAGLILWVIPHG